MATQPKSFITPEEYLTLERAAPTKSEYYRGEMFAMAGASRAHNLLVSNLLFNIRLRRVGCQVYINDLRLLVSETGLYTYPDLMAVCGKPILTDQQFDVLTNPTLIVEVLSPSTENYDRGGKFHQYMRIPSLQEYLTVSQTEMLVDQSVRQSDGAWLVKEVGPEMGKVVLASLGIEFSLTDIYRDVELSEMATKPKSFSTPEEYLTLERAAPTKSEYYRGEMFAMADQSEV